MAARSSGSDSDQSAAGIVLARGVIAHQAPGYPCLDEVPRYLRRCESLIAEWEGLRSELVSSDEPIQIQRSVEYGSRIIHSLETGTPRVVYGNVPNTGLIENLPAGCCVEVPCLVDKNGVQPVQIGRIPCELAALMQTNINVQALTVEAILKGNPSLIYHAAMLDPHTAAELDPDEISSLVDDLLADHGEWIPEALRPSSKNEKGRLAPAAASYRTQRNFAQRSFYR